MRQKKTEYFELIERFIDDYQELNGGATPTLKLVGEHIGLSESSVYKYVTVMRQQGILECDGRKSIRTRKSLRDAGGVTRVPVLGRVACGLPILAEENIEEYVSLPVSLFGRGSFYFLRAKGESMIDAGIDDGDLVLVRQQSTADYNQIVVALIEDEATLKRYRPEPGRVILHAENPDYEDIVVESCLIQGVAVKVIKDLR